MKFILLVSVCSAITGLCDAPMKTEPPFDSYRECAIFGYESSAQFLFRLDENKINNERIYTKFWCQESPSI
jgi:hypothetical protein